MKAKIIILLVPVLCLVWIYSYTTDAPVEPNTMELSDTNDDFEIWTTDSNSYTEAYSLSFTIDANNLADAAKQMRSWCTSWSEGSVDSYADLYVQIGDEEHTASFEDFFRWMGFDDEPNADAYVKENCNLVGDKVFCITEFGDDDIRKVEYLNPNDPNCLMTVNEFLFRLMGRMGE